MTYVHANCWTPFIDMAQFPNSRDGYELRRVGVHKVVIPRDLPCRYLPTNPRVLPCQPHGKYLRTRGELPWHPMVSTVTVLTMVVSPKSGTSRPKGSAGRGGFSSPAARSTECRPQPRTREVRRTNGNAPGLPGGSLRSKLQPIAPPSRKCPRFARGSLTLSAIMRVEIPLQREPPRVHPAVSP